MTNTSSPAQDLNLCVIIMALSGLLRVAATMTLAYPDHLARENGERVSRQRKHVLISIHILFLGMAAALGILGTIYGPVAIAVPVQTGSQLIFNIIAMGLIFRMRSFCKVHRTGTYIVFLSVLSLMDVGPGTQDGQNVIHLLSRRGAVIWSSLIFAGMILCTIETIRHVKGRSSSDGHHTRADTKSFFVLLMGVTLSNVAMATSGKCLGYLSETEFMLAFLAYVLSSLMGLLFSITSSTACDQGLFTPACSVALVVLNLFTGIIVWEDWKVVHTWVGYICACLLMSCGVYLLAEIDLVKEFFFGGNEIDPTSDEEMARGLLPQLDSQSDEYVIFEQDDDSAGSAVIDA